ncbi:MAG: L,D-transpeptidase [Sandaracinaceae bacterium]|nr:L,D-transpeptidase [Sandaracinaceae bacterium]
MARNLAFVGALLLAVITLVSGLSALVGKKVPRKSAQTATTLALPQESESERARREFEAMLNREYPLHGVVTGIQLTVRKEPSSDSIPMGWLRLGGHVRLARDPLIRPDCQSGWYRIHPKGHVCAGAGLSIGENITASEALLRAAKRDSVLPYRYLFVKESQTPEWYQLPSREDQRAAEAHALRYLEFLRQGKLELAERLRAGKLPNEPPPLPQVARFLEHGFFVASNGVEIRAKRRFVRTIRGTYVKEAQLEERQGSSFAGVELGQGIGLPQAWVIRTGRPLMLEVQGESMRLIEDPSLPPIPRLTRVEWLQRQRIGGQIYHVIRAANGEERYLRDWYVAVAERIPPPRRIAQDEVWVHVDLSSQTLVVYRGSEPIYATIVSTGTPNHETPTGEFTIRRKMVSDTMADSGGATGEDNYRIEEVPWTQYFEKSIALHGAFWHSQFGIPRSHGCVNLSPKDARWLFEHTLPEVPEGWHGVSTESTGFRGSKVIVTP